MSQIQINSDDPISIREWAVLHGMAVQPNNPVPISVSLFSVTDKLVERGFIVLLFETKQMWHPHMPITRDYRITAEGLAFFNFVRNIAPR